MIAFTVVLNVYDISATVSLTKNIPSDQLILVKQLYLESEAAIYLARLHEYGIEAILQNDTAYVMLPVGEKGIRLFVPFQDVEFANDLISEMDRNSLEPIDESFHNADLDEILYQKALHEGAVSSKMMYVAIVMSVILVVYVCYLSSSGMGLYHD